jgi:hypothetical protein
MDYRSGKRFVGAFEVVFRLLDAIAALRAVVDSADDVKAPSRVIFLLPARSQLKVRDELSWRKRRG